MSRKTSNRELEEMSLKQREYIRRIQNRKRTISFLRWFIFAAFLVLWEDDAYFDWINYFILC